MDVTAEWAEYVRKGRPALKEERTAERDAEFAALVERSARRMFRVAHSLLRNAHDAEDVVQEAFLKLYRNDGWRRMENERAFLARTVWRIGLDRVSRSPRGDSLDDAGEMEIPWAGATPEESASRGDERELLRQMIDRLPEELRRPLVLSAIDEMTSGEVAQVMGIPEGTVRTRVMRAKGELKKRFEAAREARR